MPVKNTRRARAARRRTRRVAASGSDLTNDQWFRILEAWACCAYCGAEGAPLQKDCVSPISRGGRYTIENVVPACASCNASKSNDEVTSWMRRRRMDEPAFLRRWVEITRALRAEDAAADDVAAGDDPALG
ncbi:HNH endonuclease [Nesterenkonia sandarakina]|uniref:5-methylcytosine-specific restriction endonuclease McrA n=1 Tax=Nesterenkonia sandarakina TaxID=272918 RepID=A0A2T0YKA8_9MICC|nr:HNH endonuclease signature motif containing protein [Nesterenkonia sandarakina]PRZ15632.1 5-methylcytosine-specific restriction endonuclease McrA [Nesterenkonia sandarakina]